MSHGSSARQVAEAGVGRATQALSWLFLLGFLLLVGIARGVYSAQDIAPSARFELLVLWGYVTFLWYWIRQQCEPHGVTFPVDLAWFMAFLWVMLAPYYLWRGQGWRGLAKFGLLSAGWVLSYVMTLIVYHGLAWLG